MKSVSTMIAPAPDGSRHFPASEIAAVQGVSQRGADTLRALNAVQADKKTGGVCDDGTENVAPAVTASAQTAKRRICTAGLEVLALLIAFFLGCK